MSSPAIALEFTPSSPISSTNDQTVKTRIKNWCGHSASVIEHGVSTTANAVKNAVSTVVYTALSIAQKVFASLNSIATETSNTASVFRKLDQHVLRFFEHVGNAQGKLGAVQTFIKRQVAFIDFVQVVADVEYFVRGKFKEQINEKGEVVKPRDPLAVIGAKFSFMVADMCGAMLWLNEMGAISLGKAAATIGEARVFGIVPKIVSSIPVLRDLTGLQNVANAIGEFRLFGFMKNTSLVFVTLRAIDLGYALFAVDAGRRLWNANNDNQKISAGLDLSSCLAELTLSAMLVAGVTNVVGLGVAGSACIILAVSSLLYRIAYEDQIKQKALTPAQV